MTPYYSSISIKAPLVLKGVQRAPGSCVPNSDLRHEIAVELILATDLT
eukprot:CAMPEP_0176285926 /NCGR_PEP_ID=MMETSP0121_2-20121125/52630_1 /TAXON_ID=160619 /ORGANISM="Kryptoperidinium foliaceum, Strain CCMP 1326" /LENGTH=47 /DNA_ID= /DNA_START= /DNA_END= /DNA_ORIENTATION=